MSERWIKCEVNQGMFSDEVVVVIKSPKGEKLSFFVPKNAVRGEHASSEVRVLAFEGNSSRLAVVPDEHQTVVELEMAGT